MTHDKRDAVSLSWSEGRYFDLWMFVHLLSGITGALFNVFVGLSPLGVYGLGCVLMVLWEVGEYVAGIRESLTNSVLDIAVGLAGVWLGLALAGVLSPVGERIAFGVTLTVTLAATAFGARAYRRRSAR